LLDGGAGGTRELKAGAVAFAFLLLAAAAPANAASGAAVYASNCALCHQFGATGLPGQFPRLAGRVAAIATSREGRDYLMKVLSYGMSGSIKVDGQSINGAMPPFRAILSADDTKAVADYLESLPPKPAKAFASLDTTEIAKLRSGPALTPSQVFAVRAALAAAGKIP
jgi:mono/diheme cytochrome c family protein